ncbi:LysR family transcriptional regulator [Acidovorax sp. SUPP2522]|uniref:LysR family transcriptional regulator n=1 Tax=unclassified Acidovorax TaxID=2684926 RepID=UPI00234BA2D6|nr:MULTISPECIES: LysR family transcriptional regulator [unclassified Acidovorax]WCM95460.1 LysR family transcriptional regulator [Acidovorax sp. GBBC 1281]GKT17331.1 LysR family transcriptional regulator [Acidovorax sp. SUPP2522]
MYLRHLQYLRSVVEHGSFARAAQACGVSQPAISQGMKALQAHFPAPLLVRSGRRYVPTELARSVAAQSSSLGQRMGALGLEPLPAPDRNVLRVGLTPSAALVWGPCCMRAGAFPIPGAASTWRRRTRARCSPDCCRGGSMAVIAPKPRQFAHPDLAERLLYELQPQVYARRGHSLARARTLAELQGAAWACVGPSVKGPVDVLTEAHRVRRMPVPKVAVRCPDFASMLHLVGQSELLAVVPHPALLGAATPVVKALQLTEALPLYGMWLFELRSRPSRIDPQWAVPDPSLQQSWA